MYVVIVDWSVIAIATLTPAPSVIVIVIVIVVTACLPLKQSRDIDPLYFFHLWM